jgi:hypothetical protein
VYVSDGGVAIGYDKTGAPNPVVGANGGLTVTNGSAYWDNVDGISGITYESTDTSGSGFVETPWVNVNIPEVDIADPNYKTPLSNALSNAASKVRIVGTVSGATETLVLDIGAGQEVLWAATYTSTASNAIHAGSTGTFTLTSDGSVTNSANSANAIRSTGATVNMNGGSINVSGDTSYGIRVSDSTLNMNGGTITASGTGGRGISAGNLSNGGATVNMNGGTINVSSGVATNGNHGSGIYAQSSSTVNMNGGTVTASGYSSYGIHAESGSTVNMDGGAIAASGTGDYYGVYAEGTVMNMTGGTITVSNTNGNGIYAADAADVNISGGHIAVSRAGSEGIFATGEGTTVDITGGTFLATQQNAKAFYVSTNAAVNMTGGFALTYNALPYTETNEGTVTVSANGIVIGYDKVGYPYPALGTSDGLYADNGTAQWAEIDGTAGINYTVSGSRARFYAMPEVTFATDEVDITDMATVTEMETAISAALDAFSTITVIGSSGEMTSTLDIAISADKEVVWSAELTSAINNNGAVIIDSDGTFTLTSDGSIANSGTQGRALSVTDATVNINGGALTVSGSTGRGIDASSNVKVNINSGSITASGEGGRGIYAAGSSTVNMTGGTVNASGLNGYGIYAYNSTFMMSDGTILATGEGAIALYRNGSSSTVSMTGGVAIAYKATPNSGTVPVTSDGILIGYDKTNVPYPKLGTSDGLTILPADASAEWAKVGGISGISYITANGTAGFAATPGITAASSLVDITGMATVVEMESAISAALDAFDVVTVIGSSGEMTSTLDIAISADKEVVWEADYSATFSTRNDVMLITGGGTFTLTSDGSVTMSGEGSTVRAIYSDDSTVNINGGAVTVSGQGGIGVYATSSSTVNMTGGTVTANGNGGRGISLFSGSEMYMTGGTIIATGSSAYAIYSNSSTANVTGGFALTYNATPYTETDGGTVTVSANGIVIGYDKVGYPYPALGTSDGLYADNGTAQWAESDGTAGLSYTATGGAAGFVATPDVVLATNEVDITDMTTVAEIKTAIDDALDAFDVVTVIGSSGEMTDGIDIRIDTGKEVLWTADYTAAFDSTNEAIKITGDGTLTLTSDGSVTVGGLGTYGYGIYATSSTVNMNGSIIVNSGYGGRGIYAYTSTVNMNGGSIAVSGESGQGIRAEGSSTVYISDGSITASGNGGVGIYASGSGTTVYMTGGTILATHTNAKAFHVSTDAIVNMTGGFAISYRAEPYTGTVSVSDGGIIIGYDMDNVPNPVLGTSDGLSVLPDDATAVWASDGGIPGISYESEDGTNSGFYAMQDVDLVIPSDEVDITDMTTVTAINTAIDDALDAFDVVTVIGSSGEMDEALEIAIPAGKEIVWTADYLSAVGIGISAIFVSSDGTFTLASDGSVTKIGNGGYGISTRKATLNINGGTITIGGASARGIFAQDNSIVNMSDGTITASGNGGVGIYASGSGTTVYMTGGTILATHTNAKAFHASTDATVNMTGGFAIAYRAEPYTGDVSVSDGGILIGYNMTTYSAPVLGTSDGLSVLPDDATAVWASDGGIPGISYESEDGTNTGFFAMPDVDLVIPSNEVDITGMATVAEMETAISRALDLFDEVVVIGSSGETPMTSPLDITIGAGKEVIWSANYSANVSSNALDSTTAVSAGSTGRFTLTSDGSIINSGALGFALRTLGATVYINGTLTAVKRGLSAGGNSTINVNGGTVTASGEEGYGIYANNNSTVNMTGGTVTASGLNGYGIHVQGSSTLNMSDGSVTATGASGRGINANGSTVNMNGGTVTASDMSGYGIHVQNSSTLNMSDGSVTATGTSGIGICANGSTVNMNSGTVTASGESSYGIYAISGSTVYVSGGTVTASGTGSRGIYATDSTVNMSGGTVTASSTSGRGIFAQSSSTLNMTGGTVTANSSGIFAQSSSTLNMSDGSVTVSGGGGIGILAAGSGTTLNMTGSTVTASGAGGYGIYAESATLNMSDGSITINGTNGYGIYASYLTTVTMSGGNITVTNIGDECIYATGADARVNMTGGTLFATHASSTAIIAADDAQVNVTGGFVIAHNTSPYTEDNATVNVTSNGVVVGYDMSVVNPGFGTSDGLSAENGTAVWAASDGAVGISYESANEANTGFYAVTGVTFSFATGDVVVTDSSGTYNGNPYQISVTLSGSAAGGTVTYCRTSDGTFTGTNPGFTDVGEYTVYVKVNKTGFNQYIGSGTVSIAQATINPADITVTNSDATYNGNEHRLTVTDTGGGSVTYSATSDGSYSGTSPGYVNAGSYTIHFRINRGSNYNIYQNSATLTISNGGELTVTVTNYNNVYDGNAHGIIVNAPDGAAVTYSDASNGTFTATNPGFTNVGNYTVYFKVNLTGYNEYSSCGTVNITPATIPSADISVNSPNVIYNGSEFRISVTDIGNGLVTYSLTSDGSYSDGSPGFTEVGTYTVYFRVDRGSNYNIYGGSGTVFIAEQAFTLTATAGTGGTLTGTASGDYAAGTPVTIIAIPNSDYEFVRWDATGVPIGTNLLSATLSFSLTSDAAVHAVFQVSDTPINPGAPKTDVYLRLDLYNTSIAAGQNALITPVISDSYGTAVKANVIISVDGAVHGIAETGSIYVIYGLTAGNHLITANYAGNEIYNPATAMAVINVTSASVQPPPFIWLPPIVSPPVVPPSDIDQNDGNDDNGDNGDNDDNGDNTDSGENSDNIDNGENDNDHDAESFRYAEFLQDVWQGIIDMIQEGITSFKVDNVGLLTEENIGDIVKAADGSPLRMIFRTFTPESTDERKIVDTQLMFYDVTQLEFLEKDVNVFTSQRSETAQTIKTKFDKYFDNIVTVVEVAQDGEFGQTGKLSVKILSALAQYFSELTVYIFDTETNKYKEHGTATVDRNGYAQFYIEKGGLYVLSNGSLKKK